MKSKINTIELLQELLAQDQFELLLPESAGKVGEKTKSDTDFNRTFNFLRLVYLMNDAVESFLVFQRVRMTGTYRKDYEGELEATLSQEGQEYALSVWQGDSVVTLFFQSLELEVHLYNYGEIGHFWVPEYEYLRVMEYQIAILRDKKKYLGDAYCTELERKLANLADFPPLNYLCWPAVPKQYIVPGDSDEPWMPSGEAVRVMEEFAANAGDTELIKNIRLYAAAPNSFLAKRVAGLLHRRVHAKTVDLIAEALREASAGYPDRSFGKETDRKRKSLLRQAEEKKRRLAQKGVRADILREEPFTIGDDGVGLQVYLMIWKNGPLNRKVMIERIDKEYGGNAFSNTF